MRIKVKPLSVNQCWKGKRYKTEKYNSFEKHILSILPNDYKVPLGLCPLEIYLKWGFSSTLSDWDNPIKPFQDILQKKYNFDDKRVFRGVVEKEIVEKGNEYIEFSISEIIK